MSELQWEQVPADVRDAITGTFGPVIKAEPVKRGIMPGVAARLYLEDGRTVFFKGAPGDSPAIYLYERETWAGGVLPPYAPAPRMLWAEQIADWVGMVFEYVDDAVTADLSPRSPHIPRVLSAVSRMNAALTPCPSATAPPVVQHVYALQAKAAHMLTERAGMLGGDLELYREALAGFDPVHLVGDTLLHYDLHAGNLLLTEDRVYVVDWSYACRGAAWVELAMLAPRLIQAGHTPGQVEQLFAGMGSWVKAPALAVTGLAAAWTLFRLHEAAFGPAEVRGDRSSAAQAGLAWIAYRLGR
ncbi:MAG: phosphotransferase [Microbispora sp.]|nr:phosphotransferase [Microbispora sp.]